MRPVKWKQGRGFLPQGGQGPNKTEVAYQQFLDLQKAAGEIHDYWWEGLKLRLAPKTFLTLDALIQNNDGSLELHDVKGNLIMPEAMVKMKVAAEKFPFPIFIVRQIPKREGGGWSKTRVGRND